MRCFALLACLAISACGDDTVTTDDADTGNPVSTDMAVIPDLAPPPNCFPLCQGATKFCNDSHHCVACLADTDCPAGNVCKVLSASASLCVPGCTGDDRCGGDGGTMACCGMQCTDTGSDTANCGACGMSCKTPHAQSTCTAGKCGGGKCDPGWGDCNGNAADGCEANLHVDATNCGKCGAKCAFANGVAACADHCYIAACQFGYDDCNGDDSDGCETTVLSDKKNCGACGNACAAAPNATVACTNAFCGVTGCNPGFLDCDAKGANGCEINGSIDANNCGKCGVVCPQGQICKGGGCTCPMCNIPNASAKCINNMCVFDACNPGFADCDNNTANGCEVDLNNDGKNCSACGMTCPMNAANCSAGKCVNGWFPVGPQTNVPMNMLAGWQQCYKDVFANAGTPVATILQACSGQHLMLACRQINSNTITVLAQSTRADVTQDTGGGNGSHDANGTTWYFNNSWSWGFATPGDGLSRNSCDTAQGNFPQNRLCFHTGGGNINGGYRCGSTAGLNGDQNWERLIFMIP